MRRAAVIGLVLAVAAAGSASAATRVPRKETLWTARAAVLGGLAEPLAPPGAAAAPHRVYNCKPGSCDFWVRGISRCEGVVRVAGSPGYFYYWFSRLRCS